MSMIWVFTTLIFVLLVIVVFVLGYNRGYRNGGRAVIKEWKRTMGDDI